MGLVKPQTNPVRTCMCDKKKNARNYWKRCLVTNKRERPPLENEKKGQIIDNRRNVLLEVRRCIGLNEKQWWI